MDNAGRCRGEEFYPGRRPNRKSLLNANGDFFMVAKFQPVAALRFVTTTDLLPG
jgi:hypothetical protein